MSQKVTELIIFKILIVTATCITICNIISVINTSVIWPLPSVYFHCLNSNNLVLLFNEYHSLWPLFLKNAVFCAGDPHIVYSLCLRHLTFLLSSAPPPQVISTIKSLF